MHVDIWSDMLLIKASRREWRTVEKLLTNVKLYQADYRLSDDEVKLIEQEALVTATLEGEDTVYAIAYPCAYKVIEPYITVMGERLRKRLESYRDIPVSHHGYELRDYQKEAVETFMKRKAAIIALPTGSGKTVVAMEIIRRLAKRTLILVPTRVLAEQWYYNLRRMCDVGIYPDGRDADVVIATYQSFRHYSEFRDFYLVIADEGHHLPAQRWWMIAKYNLFPARLVLTATPKRTDMNHLILEWWVGFNKYEKSYEELMKQGYLAQIEFRIVWVDLVNAEKLKMLEEQYWMHKYVSNKTASIKWQMKKLTANDPAKINAVWTIVSLHKDRKIIVFCELIETAKLLYKRLRLYTPAVLVGQGREVEFPGALTVDDFRNNVTRLLIATQAGEEGVDIPDADVLIMLDAPNERRFIQRVGRVARPKPVTALVYFVFSRQSMIDRRAWSRLQRVIRNAGFTYNIRHFMLK